MKKELFHILTGDSLKEQLSKTISENIIVARECLIVGDVTGNSLNELFINRANFLNKEYNVKKENYYEQTVSEFEKIKQIPQNAEIDLWFEFDLFCQINMWFIIHLITKHLKTGSVYLITPNTSSQYGFGRMDQKDLLEAYKNKINLTKYHLKCFDDMWNFYKENKHDEIIITSEQIKEDFPFLLESVKANKERFTLNRPEKTLKNIINKLGTSNFNVVFQEFIKIEYIYGFGDLQLKKMFDKINSKNMLKNKE
jgi:hypothetical protein